MTKSRVTFSLQKPATDCTDEYGSVFICVICGSSFNNPLCSEIMTPESVGVPANALVLGKHSGRHALSLRFLELGYDITPAELDAAYKSFTNLADRKNEYTIRT